MTTPHPKGQKGTQRRFKPEPSHIIKKEGRTHAPAPTEQEREEDRQKRIAKRIPVKPTPKPVKKEPVANNISNITKKSSSKQ